MSKLPEKHKNPLVEKIAEEIWNSTPHKMLEAAGHPTNWEDQPRIIKREKWRLAIKMLAVFSEHATADDVHDRIKAEISTPAARWRENRKKDPHSNYYECEQKMTTHEELVDMIGALGALVDQLCKLGILKETDAVSLPEKDKSWLISELIDEVDSILVEARQIH